MKPQIHKLSVSSRIYFNGTQIERLKSQLQVAKPTFVGWYQSAKADFVIVGADLSAVLFI